MNSGTDGRQRLPSVDLLLRTEPARRATSKFGRPVVKRALQAAVAAIRSEVSGGAPLPETDAILARAIGSAARDYYGMSEVINATGVLLHTGLGRAPLPAASADAAAQAARGYCDLEVERQTGARGRRTSRAEALLSALTGAEDALVVNNNAAALLLALAALGRRKEVLVSRGELIEIGGEFRLPEIMAASGAKLVEVGTTNRTSKSDYARALGPRSGLMLKVHPSNYRVVGFTHSVGLKDMVELGNAHGVPVLYDIGSGLLDRYPEVPPDEPSVVEAIRTGADLVCFSGDKLLGGPQAGLLAGRAAVIQKLKRHPIARVVRVDKMTVGALESVLRMYSAGRRREIPLWRSVAARPSGLMSRAEALASVLPGARALRSEAVAGGGSLPGFTIPSAELALPVPVPARMAERLRLGRPPVFCRMVDGAVSFDLRTVPPEDDDRLLRAIRYALEQD